MSAALPAMSDDEIVNPSSQMLRSWERNARAWTDAVRERRIASRRAGTDAAIVDAVLATRANSVLDVGCGEGWLARELASRGRRVVGIDASAALIAQARALGGATFEAMPYRDLGTNAQRLGAPFDLAVCNFSLLDDDLAPMLGALRDALCEHGRLLIQTVHPWIARGDGPYLDGWRIETFAGFGAGFVEPMPWYFRTLASWIDSIGAAAFRVDDIDEPIDAESGTPLSLLIGATRIDLADRR